MVDQQYQFKIGSEDFSDCISQDGYEWTVQSYSAESSTGQDTKGVFHVPILGERVQLKFKCPEYVTQERLKQLVQALKLGTKGQREISVTYDDPLFGWITRKFYCTNIPWIKSKLPSYPNHYGENVTFQLASSEFIKGTIANVTPLVPPIFSTESEYSFKINGKEFNDIIAIDGFRGQSIDQSLESKTGLTLDGKFHLPIIGTRTQLQIKGIEYIEINRFKNLGKELGFGKLGERSHMVEYNDMAFGTLNKRFYCTEISGTRVKLPNYPYHYIQNVTFQQAMKQFI